MRRAAHHAIALATLGISAIIMQPVAKALSPLTPALSAESSQDLLAQLSNADLPEVAQNSVVMAVSRVLGFAPKLNEYKEVEPFPHLPSIEGYAEPISSSCASVRLVAAYTQPRRGAVSLSGVYCLVGTARWEARYQNISKAP